MKQAGYHITSLEWRVTLGMDTYGWLTWRYIQRTHAYVIYRRQVYLYRIRLRRADPHFLLPRHYHSAVAHYGSVAQLQHGEEAVLQPPVARNDVVVHHQRVLSLHVQGEDKSAVELEVVVSVMYMTNGNFPMNQNRTRWIAGMRQRYPV